MNDSDDSRTPPRVDRADPLAAQLVRSASLDVAPSDAAERVRGAALAALRSEQARRHGARRRATLVAFAASAALAAGAWLTLRARPPAPSLAAEPPSALANGTASQIVAPGAPAAPAASAPAQALRPCPKLVSAAGTSPMIDDMEDRNARLLVSEGRFGTWGANGDARAKQTPKAGENAFPSLIPQGRAQSRYALHAFGEQLAGSGTGIGASFAPGSCYDASRYTGVEFWARGAGRIHFGITTVDVMAAEWGGLCQKNCYDEHQKPLDLTQKWQLYRVRWAELAQRGFGTPVAFDAARLWSFEFRVDAADTPFDFWVDDVRFTTP